MPRAAVLRTGVTSAIRRPSSWASPPPTPHSIYGAPFGVYNETVEKTARIFNSFEEADKEDARQDAAMTPKERLRIVIELRDRRHPDAAQQGLARVCRITELERR
jgi:hypothetical protein